MKNILAVLVSVLLCACALPQTNVRSGSSRPQLAIQGAPSDSLLFVDGISIGSAAQYDGNPKVLIVEEGLHQVEIRRNGKPIHVERTFVSSGETRLITINPGIQ